MRFSKSSGNRAGLIESSILPFYFLDLGEEVRKNFSSRCLVFFVSDKRRNRRQVSRRKKLRHARCSTTCLAEIAAVQLLFLQRERYLSDNEDMHRARASSIPSPPLLLEEEERGGGPTGPARASSRLHAKAPDVRETETWTFPFPRLREEEGGESSHRPPVIYPPPPSIDQLEISSRSSVGGRGGGRNAETVFSVRDRKRLRAKRKKERKNGAINCFRDKRLGRRGGRKRWLVRRGAFD